LALYNQKSRTNFKTIRPNLKKVAGSENFNSNCSIAARKPTNDLAIGSNHLFWQQLSIAKLFYSKYQHVSRSLS
jgi:hypothetical protein